MVSLDQVKAEHYSCGGLYKEIFEAADLYGIFEDLYGSDKFFRYVLKTIFKNVGFKFSSNNNCRY